MKKQGFCYRGIIALLLICTVATFSCSKDDDENNNNSSSSNGYILSPVNSFTSFPNKVNVAFKVEHSEGEYFETYLKEDFAVTENGNNIIDKISFANYNALDIDFYTVIMIDVSISNSANIPDLQFAVKQFINSMHSKEKMALYTFSGDVIKLKDFTNNKDELIQAIQTIAPGISSRNLYGAAKQGVGQYSVQENFLIKNGCVVILTGGEDNVGLVGFQDALNTRGEKKIYTYYTLAEGEEGSNEMKQLSNGIYIEVPTITDLSVEMIELHKYIDSSIENYYELSYTSYELGDKENEVHISLLNNLNSSSSGIATTTFNSHDFQPYSEDITINNDTITYYKIQKNKSDIFSASTVFPLQTPSYSWYSSNVSVFTITGTSGSSASVNAIGNFGDTASIIVRDLANDFVKSFICEVSAPFEIGEFEDPRDGQVYQTVRIGEQWWFAENLNYASDDSWYYEDSDDNEEYGRLYTLSSAIDACPDGWHVPTDDEWKELEGFADTQFGINHVEWDISFWRGFDAGFRLKDNSGNYWEQPNQSSNYYGFTALPAGYRNSSGTYFKLHHQANFWVNTQYSGASHYYRRFDFSSEQIYRYFRDKDSGLSVRCIKN